MQFYHGKSSIQQEGGIYQRQIEFKFKEETSKVLRLEHNFVWCRNLDISESGSEIRGNF
jgi:hypothetical protein